MSYSDFSVQVNELHQHLNDKGYWDSFCHGKRGWFDSGKATKSEVEQATDKLQELIGRISYYGKEHRFDAEFQELAKKCVTILESFKNYATAKDVYIPLRGLSETVHLLAQRSVFDPQPLVKEQEVNQVKIQGLEQQPKAIQQVVRDFLQKGKSGLVEQKYDYIAKNYVAKEPDDSSREKDRWVNAAGDPVDLEGLYLAAINLQLTDLKLMLLKKIGIMEIFKDATLNDLVRLWQIDDPAVKSFCLHAFADQKIPNPTGDSGIAQLNALREIVSQERLVVSYAADGGYALSEQDYRFISPVSLTDQVPLVRELPVTSYLIDNGGVQGRGQLVDHMPHLKRLSFGTQALLLADEEWQELLSALAKKGEIDTIDLKDLVFTNNNALERILTELAKSDVKIHHIELTIFEGKVTDQMKELIAKIRAKNPDVTITSSYLQAH